MMGSAACTPGITMQQLDISSHFNNDGELPGSKLACTRALGRNIAAGSVCTWMEPVMSSSAWVIQLAPLLPIWLPTRSTAALPFDFSSFDISMYTCDTLDHVTPVQAVPKVACTHKMLRGSRVFVKCRTSQPETLSSNLGLTISLAGSNSENLDDRANTCQ